MRLILSLIAMSLGLTACHDPFNKPKMKPRVHSSVVQYEMLTCESNLNGVKTVTVAGRRVETSADGNVKVIDSKGEVVRNGQSTTYTSHSELKRVSKGNGKFEMTGWTRTQTKANPTAKSVDELLKWDEGPEALAISSPEKCRTEKL